MKRTILIALLTLLVVFTVQAQPHFSGSAGLAFTYDDTFKGIYLGKFDATKLKVGVETNFNVDAFNVKNTIYASIDALSGISTLGADITLPKDFSINLGAGVGYSFNRKTGIFRFTGSEEQTSIIKNLLNSEIQISLSAEKRIKNIAFGAKFVWNTHFKWSFKATEGQSHIEDIRPALQVKYCY